MKSIYICCFIYFLTYYPDNVKTADFGLHVDVTDDGKYTLAYGSTIWIYGAPPFFNVDGIRYSGVDGSLKFIKVTNGTGTTGHFGLWTSRDIHYVAGTTNIIASVRNSPYGLVIFNVKYVDGANSTAAPDENQIVCGFPGFKLGSPRSDLGFLGYGGHFTGDTDKSIGKFDKSAVIPDGLEGSGPLAVFDHSSNTVLITPVDNFMASSMWKDAANGYIYWGIMGGIDEIPVNFEYNVMINYNMGINTAISAWGLIVQFYHNNTKGALTADNDVTTRYLGYWTGDGDYYSKGPQTGKNYEETIVDVLTESKNLTKLPYKYFQLDEWWCIKTADRVKYWAADPTALPKGMTLLENVTNLKFLMYSGVWSSDNVYAKQNGGKYTFIIEGDTAVPDDKMFWDDLFGNAVQWGLTTYEQDGMDETFMRLNATKTDLYFGSRWLNDMGEAAARYNISILYSDAYPRHAFQSLLIPAVTQARVSSNYGKNKDQWKIGISSIFANALNLAPNKDSFRTSHNSSDFIEPYPELQQVVALLSRGVVGNGDGLGYVNSTILRMCCAEDGRILHPMHPAKAIDSQILQAAFQDGSGPDGEVWSTFTQIPSIGMPNTKYGVIFAAGLTKPFSITPKNTHLDYDLPKSKIYRWNQPYQFDDFSIGSSFTLENCSLQNFCLYFTTPVIEFDGQEIMILGELDKWIHMPHQRVQQIKKESTTLTMDIEGSPGESIEIWIAINGKLAAIATRADENGHANFVYERKHSNSAASVNNESLAIIVLCVFSVLLKTRS